MPHTGKPTPEQMKKMFEEMQRKENEGLTPEEIEAKNKEKEMKKRKNIALIQETLEICENGSYDIGGETVNLGLTSSQMREAQVFLPEEIRSMSEADADADAGTDAEIAAEADATANCAFSCENKDALSLAHELCNDPSYTDGNGANKILLLNLASAVKPGGGVRDGMGGQEEDLCRKSSLLLSLENDAAKSYYEYNEKLDTLMGSDGVIVSPYVAVFRNDKEELLDAPFTISVITCSAPNVRFGFEGMTQEEYEKMLSDRIEGLLRCATGLGYKNIILGAFGCGAFKNDAALVSDTFYRALTGSAGRGLEHADFAVLCTPGKEYNFNEFSRNFSRNNE